MNRLVIVGSSRTNGRCARIATDLFETCIEEYPDDELFLASVASLDIRPCENCGGCKNLAEQAKEALREGTDAADSAEAATPRRCVIDDDMHLVYEAIEAADEAIVISPVFFAGPPAQLKALIDRLQPYFWLNTRHTQPRRSATLHIIGEGHDPIGYDPLIGCVTSSLLCAGFELDLMFDWVGKLAPDGTILEDPDEYAFYEDESEGAEPADSTQVEAEVLEVTFAAETPKQSAERPKLDLNADQRKGGAGKGSGNGSGSGKSGSKQGSSSGKSGGSKQGNKPSGNKSGGKSNGSKSGSQSGKGGKGGSQGGNRSGQGNRANQNGKGGKSRG